MRTFICVTILLSAFLAFAETEQLAKGFANPSAENRPWVYWFIMDGNLSKEGITADFEAMQKQGIGGIILMEVNIGVPRGNVGFMSEEWQNLFVHIVREAERCNLQVTLNSGPGWTGSGGPWIQPEDSMLHLVASEKNVTGPVTLNEKLPNPIPRKPFFGEGQLPAPIEKARKEWFKDVKVSAFPSIGGLTPPALAQRIADIDEKALYYRAPYSSSKVKPRIAEPDVTVTSNTISGIDPAKIIDLTGKLQVDGTLNWDVPAGDWTILRFAAASTGQNTRPAPAPGLGLECSKMDRDAFDIHYKNYIEKLLQKVNNGNPVSSDSKAEYPDAGWKYLHIDSWEMSSQNYSRNFFEEFQKRRGYDPMPYLPAYLGFIVQNQEITERFLWDVRQTAQELIIQNHGEYLRELAHKNGMKLSIEPYDMMPCNDMTFGGIADVPMCEFWSAGYGFDSIYSCFEAASIAHIHGRQIVGAEAFTSSHDKWRQNPKSMKLQGDWAFCTGINRFTFHRFQHQPLPDKYPGFSMGIHGVHWERTQTWWELSAAYHQYLARCQYLLRKGTAVVDVLYLEPEGAPEVFTPPSSAMFGTGVFRDQRGYRFDGCDPATLLKSAYVKDGSIAFKGENTTAYKMLVLPNVAAMTLPLLQKIAELADAGATVVGNPPKRSPGLQHYPQIDDEIKTLGKKIQDSLISVTAAGSTPLDLSAAKWIWFAEDGGKGDAFKNAPAGIRFFRNKFPVAEDAKVVSAQFIGSADNRLMLKINGKEVCKAEGGKEQIAPAAVTAFIKNGENVIEITAENDVNNPPNAPNPAGLIARFQVIITEKDGRESMLNIVTDSSWESSQDEKTWTKPQVIGGSHLPIWAGYIQLSPPELYPDYEFTANILKKKGVPVDFDCTPFGAADNAVRFFHRQDGETDIYFLSNRSDQPFDGEVKFRVTKKAAAVWEPMTGKQYRTPPLQENNGQTSFSLHLEGSQSLFVIFSNRQDNAKEPVWQKAAEQPVLDLNGGWDVTFDTKRGGIGVTKFDRLRDWSKSKNDKIRYFSGIAIYEKTFERTKTDTPLYLDLGNVEVIARVTL
ncbi:MAG: hypothetical protein LBT46_03920, partial [Planctomycetaceae bacterium]|nr:hypothetical protein [Planctomycetaceae bacterium]